MAPKLSWTPWHGVVKLRDDLRTGKLSLADFAADLHDVMMQRGARPIYEDPAEFFALTYPTFSLRELAKDVVLRLAGKNTKAIRQLELTYGGGKTHTLVTLRHLVYDPASLPKLPAVEQFKSHIGVPLPREERSDDCGADGESYRRKIRDRRYDQSKAPWLVFPTLHSIVCITILKH
jgi:hypothetical protein